METGPAYGQDVHRSSFIVHRSDGWPTYRHDPARSGSTKSAVPAALEPSWKSDLGGKLSSVVVADGNVFVAQVDAHTVHALDAKSGKVAWRFTAGGRVDSPPTIYQGRALFGCADGWVYCLRAADGELVWRFRAAPEERRVIAYNQLESTWPVHGSVLVEDGSAYFVAGRSIFLDGGMYLYRLDPATGKVLAELRMDERDPQTGLEPQETVRGTNMKGALPDVLSSDGTSIYMRHKRFDRDLVVQEENVPHLYSSVGFLDDSWWHRTYWLVGSEMRSGYGGWPVIGSQVPAGRILATDESSIYGFGRDQYVHFGSHVGIDGRTIFHFRPDRDGKMPFTHYRLFGIDRAAKPAPAQAKAKPGQQKRRARPAARTKQYRWTEEVPLLVRAMVLAHQTLFLSGPPDGSKLVELPAALEGRSGGLLEVVSTSEGEKLAEYRLDAPPVFDGLAAAGGRLYLATMNGQVICFGGK